MATNKDVVIELDEEEEGNLLYLDDLFFKKIGDPIPLRPQPWVFDLENPPTQPLAVSENPQAIFLAHSEGFYVVRTKEVIETAKEMNAKGKTCSIQEICVVDVKIGKVDIVALSTDSSTLAACVSGQIHFFSVSSLLNKDQKPLFSCSLDEFNGIKDFRWRKKKMFSYLVLSKDGVLYQGDADGSLEELMNNVDAVDWNAEGNFIAAAKKNTLCIFSSKTRERSQMSMSFKSIHDTDSSCIVKVDSIKWVRQDCIILGCFQITEDGQEIGYFIQIISSKDGNISEVSSKPSVLSFGEVFTGIIDDIVPFGSGPHLMLNYLKHRELTIVANRKNTDQHIILFGWSYDDGQKDVALMELAQEDLWLPRIALQDNEENNLIMGFGVDNTSSYEKVEIMLGGEQKELTTYCTLLCLTLDGKLLMFYVAGSTESSHPGLSSEEEDSLSVVPVSSNSLRSVELETEGTVLDPHQKELEAKGDHRIVTESDESNDHLKPPCDIDLKPDSTISNSVGRSQAPLQSLDATLEQTGPGLSPTFLNANAGFMSWQQNSNSQRPTSTPHIGGFDSGFRDPRKSENQNYVFARSGVGMGNESLEINKPGTLQSNNKDLLKSGPLSGSKSSSAIQVPTSQRSPSTHLSKSIFSFKDPTAGHSSGTSTDAAQASSKVVEKFQATPSIHGPQAESSGRSAFDNSLRSKLQPMHANLGIRTPIAVRSEPDFSKGFGSVNDMVEQLDTLLSYIEGEGGFRDACITGQKNSVLGLEQGLENLSGRCRGWKNSMEEQLKATQHLLDKTVQVLARKIYMQGIVKQASDIQYWDLWNRQKLSPELDLRRRKILQVNQDLTNQLIELERHFNTLELLRFGENSGVSRDHRMPRSGMEPLRHGQSYQRLYNTMNSQLAAAEQLSDCLTKQMDVLNIDSPSVKRKSVAKELFESIGLPYDGDSFNSPNVKKAIQTPESVKQISLSSSSTNIKEQSRRNPSTVMKTFEPETARRRRDSLGRSWSSFEPPKTTVKRMMVQEKNSRVNQSKSSLVTTKDFSSQLQQASAAFSLMDRSPKLTLNSCSNKDKSSEVQLLVNQDLQGKALPFSWGNGHSGLPQVTGGRSFTLQVTERSTLPSSTTVGSTSSPRKFQDNTTGGSGLVSSRSSVGATHFGKSDYPVIQPGSFLNSAATSQTKAPSGSINAGDFMTPFEKSDYPQLELGSFSKSVVTSLEKTSPDSINQGLVAPINSSAVPIKNQTLLFPPLSALTPITSADVNPPKQETGTSKTEAALLASIVSSTVAVPSSVTSPSLSVTSPSPASNPLFPSSLTSIPVRELEVSIKPSNDASLVVPLVTSFPSSSSSLSFPISKPLDEQVPSSVSSVFTDLTGHVAPKEPELPANNLDLKEDAQVAVSEPIGDIFQPKSEATVTSVDFTSGTHTCNLNSTSTAEATIPCESKSLSAAGSVQFPLVVSTSNVATDGKSQSLVVAAVEEDEMEEEAPDMSFNLSLGGLGSFGFGSTSNSEAPKPNPFGVPFPNAAPNPVSSPFNMTVPSGELFRPASFNFQSVQPCQPPNMASGFNVSASVPEPTKSGFGQPTHIGAGQQALGSVLGSFGQSRQLGSGLPGASFGSPSGFVTSGNSGYGTHVSGGFAGAAASGAGGFVGAGGFAGAAASGAGGFAGAAASGTGVGFGAFGNKQGGSAFSALNNSSAGSGKPSSQLFTQMRK